MRSKQSVQFGLDGLRDAKFNFELGIRRLHISPELSDVRKVVNISSQEEQGEEKEFPQDMT